MNPVMIPIVTIPLLHMALKWAVVVLIVGMAAFTDRLIPHAGILILFGVSLWYVFVVTHNVVVVLAIHS